MKCPETKGLSSSTPCATSVSLLQGSLTSFEGSRDLNFVDSLDSRGKKKQSLNSSNKKKYL